MNVRQPFSPHTTSLHSHLRFHYMLRVVKPGAPMSVGTWSLTCYGVCLALVGVLAWPIFGGIRELLPAPLWDGALLLLGAVTVRNAFVMLPGGRMPAVRRGQTP